MKPDDRLALLVAVHHAAGEGYAPIERIRVALGKRRLHGHALAAGLVELHAHGLTIAHLRDGWGLTPDGFRAVVGAPEPPPRPTSIQRFAPRRLQAIA